MMSKTSSGNSGPRTPKIKNSLLAHLVMVGYISLSRSASPKFSYTCHGLVIANPAQAGPPAPETVGAVLATRPSGPWTSAKSRAHLVKNAPAHTTGGFKSAVESERIIAKVCLHDGSVGRTDGEGRDAELVARVRIAAEATPLTMRACQPAPAQQSQQAFRRSSVVGSGWAEGDR